MPLLGVYAENSPARLQQFEQWSGRSADLVHVFLDERNWDQFRSSARWHADQLWGSNDHKLFWSVPMLVAGATLDQAAAGSYNENYRAVAQTIASGTPGTDEIIIRPGWELNGSWFAWSAVGRPNTYIEAYRELVDTFRSVSDRFKFEWNVNEAWGGLNPATAYPGDQYVDYIGMDFYWRHQFQGTDPVRAFNTLVNMPYGLRWLESFADARGKPTAYSEWGSMGNNAEPFFRLLSQWMDQNDVAYHMFWDSNTLQPSGMLSNGQNPTSGAAFQDYFGTPDPVSVSTTTTAQSAFGAVPQIGADPVTIRAARFDNGGQGVSWNDSTPSQDLGGFWGRDAGADIWDDDLALGFITSGEWVEYTVNVATGGTYALQFTTSSMSGGRSITASFEQNGSFYRTAPSVAVPDTDLRQFVETQAVRVDLNAGTNVVRLTFNGGDFRLESFELDYLFTPTPPTPPPVATQTPWNATAFQVGSSPFAIAAWQFDRGGQGVAYNDTTAEDLGGSLGRNAGVDINGNNESVGWTRAGEWIEYTLNLASGGRYAVSYETASAASGGSITAQFFQGSSVVTAAAAGVGNTGNNGIFADTAPVYVDLAAGQHVMRLNIGGGFFGIREIELDLL